MNKVASACVAVGSLWVGEMAWGAISITPDYTILTAVKDASNLDGSGYRFRGTLTTDPGDPTYYVNAVTLVPGSNYDPGLGVSLPSDGGGLTLDDGSQYVLGTPLPADSFLDLSHVATNSGTVDSALANGLYDFSIEFRGGESSSADDVLASWALQLDVVDSLDVTATGQATPAVIGYGEVTTVSVTLTNNMTGRTLITTSWYYGNGGMENGPYALEGTFAGNWFAAEILPGQSRTDGHTEWSTNGPDFYPAGTYVGNLGVFGGLYPGDEYSFKAMNPAPSVELVPEPGIAGVALTAAVAATGRRRERR